MENKEVFQMTIQSRFDGQYTTDWDKCLAGRSERMKSSIIRELLKYTMLPDVISFAGGLPAPEAFPVRDFRDACSWVLEHEAEHALQYGTTEGYAPLKDYLIETMSKYEIPAVRDNILFTNGSQQALDLLGRAFIDDGDKIVTGRPTYLGAIQAWNVYGPRYLTVPLDDDGMRMDILETVLQANPGVKFIYVLPNFHNPAGTTLPLERRLRLVELAVEHSCFLIEDDPYGQLRFEGEDITPVFALHKENTIYLSTFSKTLAPGLRLGWIVAPERVIAKLVQAKQGADLNTSTLVQYLACDICQRGLVRAHVKKIRDCYRERRDVMLEAMEEHFPPSVNWTRPQGGLFLWARMPECMDAEKLLHVAIEEKVAFVPGHVFYPDGEGGRCCMRLNFSYSKPEIIREGIERLGRAIKRQMDEIGYTPGSE
jgi:2-aminoadipate transaminase